jgi:hypothetical protein
MPPIAQQAPIPTAEALARQFAAEGFTPGQPAGLTAEALAVDRQIARQARCPRCRRRGMQVQTYHDGAGRYRVLLSCAVCGAAEEF